MRNKMTILVDSFDGYSDIWSTFFSVFQRYWSTCPFPLYLVSNHMKYEGINTINTGNEVSWSKRTLSAVEQIDSDYVLLLLEDYFLGDYVKTEKIEEALGFLINKNGKYLRLTDIPKSRFNKKKDLFYNLYSDEEYAVNLQASIWNRSFLIESLKKFEGSAWNFEIGFLSESVKSAHFILDGYYGMMEDPLDIHNGVLKGKWFTSSVAYFEKRGFDIEWESRGKLSPKIYARHFISTFLKDHISYRSRKSIKRILKAMGVRFASDY